MVSDFSFGDDRVETGFNLRAQVGINHGVKPYRRDGASWKCLGSACVSRAGVGVSPTRTWMGVCEIR